MKFHPSVPDKGQIRIVHLHELGSGKDVHHHVRIFLRDDFIHEAANDADQTVVTHQTEAVFQGGEPLQNRALFVAVNGNQVLFIKQIQFPEYYDFRELVHIPGVHRVINGNIPVFVVPHDFSIGTATQNIHGTVHGFFLFWSGFGSIMKTL